MMRRLALIGGLLSKQSFASGKEPGIKPTETNNDESTVFDLILNKKIPSKTVFEDSQVFAFADINPSAPTHILIIPKEKQGLTGISKAQENHKEILGHMLITAAKIAQKLELESGYRLVINEGSDGQQTVKHLHLHLIGGRKMSWPPG